MKARGDEAGDSAALLPEHDARLADASQDGPEAQPGPLCARPHGASPAAPLVHACFYCSLSPSPSLLPHLAPFPLSPLPTPFLIPSNLPFSSPSTLLPASHTSCLRKSLAPRLSSFSAIFALLAPYIFSRSCSTPSFPDPLSPACPLVNLLASSPLLPSHVAFLSTADRRSASKRTL